ncbi:hypothetical protein LAZ67_2004096 [Cordylochernes scorpioides]|uniref:Mos1 transposase HTH domain-containing protein n=1 Tax=Cordylochernes scorpioides TaxID=51811 RepID=A0ABY6K4L7_9ARAC|nr:hypothetical protein LAZ67_2004096 [Cordylochernes scorpioides]
MELPLVNVSTCELRSVIRFFTAKNETAVNIHRNLVSVYSEECMSIKMVRRWRSWFLEGRQNVHDDEQSGRPVTATDNAAVAAVQNAVEADRRVTIDEIMIRLPPGIEIGRSSIGTIMSDILNFRKVCARWVPHLLLENHKQQRMEAARAFLEIHQRDGDQLFSRIVTGDEIWVHHSTPETKRQSMVWKKPEESAPKKAKVTISAGKVMAMEIFKWEFFTHPPYSPELAPSDFHLFPALKWHHGGKHFANDDEVQAEENHWLRRQDMAWYNRFREVDMSIDGMEALGNESFQDEALLLVVYAAIVHRWIGQVERVVDVFSVFLESCPYAPARRGVRTLYSNSPNISSLIRNPDTKSNSPYNPSLLSGCVYSIPCADCDVVYVGETGRSVGTRLEEHRKNISRQDEKSAIYQHIRTTNHSFDLANPSVHYSRIHNKQQRLTLEALVSQGFHAINRHIDLPESYQSLFP